MTRDHEYRLYRYKLAMDLLDGELENPNSMVEAEGIDATTGDVIAGSATEIFKPEYHDARVRLAIDMLKDLGLTPRRARDIYGLADVRLLREMSGRDLRELQEPRLRGSRGRPHPGRPVRSNEQVAADMRALAATVEVDAGAAEMDDPAPVARNTPSQSLLNLLEAVRGPRAPAAPEVPQWGDTAQVFFPEPAARGTPLNPDGDIADDPATMAVDRFGVEYELPRKGKRGKDGKDMLTSRKKAPAPPPKPQRRLVVKRNRPPVAPDD